jgi:membrane-bound inhibitor of C-type lysozyme
MEFPQMIRRLLLIAFPWLLAACQTSLPMIPAAAANASTYTCDDGRAVQAAYPDADTAVLTLDRQPHRLHIALAASGARYVGDSWQWWTKGMRQAMLAPLQPGETYASVTGVACHVQ